MTRYISYQGVDWEVCYEWEDDTATDMRILSIKTKADIYDHLQQTTIDGLYKALEESFE